MTVRHENKDRLFLFMRLQRPTSFLLLFVLHLFLHRIKRGDDVPCKTHIWALWNLNKLGRAPGPPTPLKKLRKRQNVTLTLILNLHLIEQEPSGSCLPIFCCD